MLSTILLTLFTGAAQAPQPDAWARPLARAVAVGSLPTLRAMREERLHAMGESATDEDRYLLAYLNWRIQQNLDRKKSKKERDQLLKEALRQLDRILEDDPRNAEVLALRGSVIGDRIHGFFRGMTLGPKASKALNRAADLEPDNPRVALQRGIGRFFTPKSFGGGLAAAEEELRRAVRLFEAEPEDQPWPNWGRHDALGWLGQVLAEKGEIAEARELYQQVLAEDPEQAWVRDELLPALDERR